MSRPKEPQEIVESAINFFSDDKNTEVALLKEFYELKTLEKVIEIGEDNGFIITEENLSVVKMKRKI